MYNGGISIDMNKRYYLIDDGPHLISFTSLITENIEEQRRAQTYIDDELGIFKPTK